MGAGVTLRYARERICNASPLVYLGVWLVSYRMCMAGVSPGSMFTMTQGPGNGFSALQQVASRLNKLRDVLAEGYQIIVAIMINLAASNQSHINAEVTLTTDIAT
jgi:hypothetical protein